MNPGLPTPISYHLHIYDSASLEEWEKLEHWCLGLEKENVY